MDQVLAAAKEARYTGQLWFQMDAGADFHAVLSVIPTLDAWTTVRVAQSSRRMWEGETLAQAADAAPLKGCYSIDVAPAPGRPARKAKIEVRASPQVLSLCWRWGRQAATPCPLYVVQARETSAPKGQAPIDWMLFTSRPVNSFQNALEVIDAYSKRWRIEEVHKSWKSVTRVEDSALESTENFYRWATILFSVAVRIERLKHLARSTPTLPATVEFSDDECEAIHLLKKHNAKRRAAPFTIADAVLCTAELGGFTSVKSSGGPPGTITIGRGLSRVTEVAAVLSLQREKLDQS